MTTNFPNGVRSRGVPLPSGGIPPTGGNVFHVDSGHAAASDSGPGTNPNHPMATLDAAIALCTANNGDQIWVYPGHAEAVIAAGGLDLDVAGITIIFLGNDNDRGTITFSTDVGADMDVDAADITLINPRFVAGIDALTGPIDVNAARFKMYNAIYQDAAAMGTTDCIVADAAADDMVIDGWDYRVSTTGTQKQSNIQIAGADRPTLRNIRITGDFGTGVIENGTAWVDALLENIFVDNAAAGPAVVGILLQATSSGQARNVYVRVSSGVVAVTADNDMQWFDCWGVGVDAEAAWPIGVNGYNVGAFPTGAAAADGVGLAEVLRYAQENIIVGAGTALPANSSLYGVLAGATGVATYPAEAAPDNGISLAEVLRAVYNSVAHDSAASVVTRQTGWGNIVTKTEDVEPTADDLFTVTGKVLITLLTGEVTNAIGANVTDYALRVKTTNEAIAAATGINGDVIGTMYIVSGHPNAALNGGLTPTTRVAALTAEHDSTFDRSPAHSPMIVGLAGGSLTIESTHTAGDASDAIIWTLMYIPLEASASVAAAA